MEPAPSIRGGQYPGAPLRALAKRSLTRRSRRSVELTSYNIGHTQYVAGRVTLILNQLRQHHHFRAVRNVRFLPVEHYPCRIPA